MEGEIVTEECTYRFGVERHLVSGDLVNTLHRVNFTTLRPIWCLAPPSRPHTVANYQYIILLSQNEEKAISH